MVNKISVKKENNKSKEIIKVEPIKPVPTSYFSSYFPPRMVGVLADEVAKTIMERLPHMMRRSKKPKKAEKIKKLERAIFLDTSAIIDGRIFSVITMGLLHNVIAIPEDILLELKHIADSQDVVKRERGRKGMEKLEELKKVKGIQVVIATTTGDTKTDKAREVDEKLIQITKSYHGKLITCDYNLEKKALIQGVSAVNVNALAHALKVTAVPGEALHIEVLHQGKELLQGVGYLDDGTMIVVEQGVRDIGKSVDVVVSRVIQTAAGRILFAKKI